MIAEIVDVSTKVDEEIGDLHTTTTTTTTTTTMTTMTTLKRKSQAATLTVSDTSNKKSKITHMVTDQHSDSDATSTPAVTHPRIILKNNVVFVTGDNNARISRIDGTRGPIDVKDSTRQFKLLESAASQWVKNATILSAANIVFHASNIVTPMNTIDDTDTTSRIVNINYPISPLLMQIQCSAKSVVNRMVRVSKKQHSILPLDHDHDDAEDDDDDDNDTDDVVDATEARDDANTDKLTTVITSNA